jgi:C1A family cysteine protease
MDKNVFMPSRLFIYYNERVLNNSVSVDSGAYLSDGIASLTIHGTCKEPTWPYNIAEFATLPPPNCYAEALNNKVLVSQNIPQNARAMKTCLTAGIPFVVGINVFQSFMSNKVAKTGQVPMPNVFKEPLLGGHAVACVGYNEYTKQWIMRNSWGPNWGVRGYFYLPYDYLLRTSLASDLWGITKESSVNVPVSVKVRTTGYVRKRKIFRSSHKMLRKMRLHRL